MIKIQWKLLMRNKLRINRKRERFPKFKREVGKQKEKSFRRPK